MQNIFIGVASHKPYKMPEDEAYVPIQVGAKDKDTIQNYTRDDQGENISQLNANFCELTGIYYIWKNIDAPYKGLVHYRRYFKGTQAASDKDPFTQIAGQDELSELLSKHDIILPKKRNYYIESNRSHYCHAHESEALTLTELIIREKCPPYLESFERVMHKSSAHMFNMFIMKGQIFDEYCSWLFGILFGLQGRLDISNYSVQEARVFGYISELLLDVWLLDSGYSWSEMPVLYIEKQQLPKKMINFLKRKFFGRSDAHITSRID